jgi:hypothetical protein
LNCHLAKRGGMTKSAMSGRFSELLQASERENCSLGFKVGIVLAHNVVAVEHKPPFSFIEVSEISGRTA